MVLRRYPQLETGRTTAGSRGGEAVIVVMEMEVVQVVVIAAAGDELQVIAQVVRHTSTSGSICRLKLRFKSSLALPDLIRVRRNDRR